jgi:dTDP-4-amino-4,6-dideoxygalactose transaminase
VSRLEDLAAAHRLPATIFVTRPTLPPLAEYEALLGEIWESRWLTNEGQFHRSLESRLAGFLGVEHVNAFCNGTIALMVALQALRINSGEVITTPFTFPATPHVLFWNHITPVFCDIDERTFSLDPARIERLIGSETRAILPVHVYGIPSDVDAIQRIADRHGLHVIYDAAHCFGVRYRGRSLASYGDMAMLSFHATKLFSTLEGGALVTKTPALAERVRFLRNFGISDEETVIAPGINGKMNELQAAFGLLHLQMVEREIESRRKLTEEYRRGLCGIPGLALLEEMPELEHNFSHFPVVIDPDRFGMTRDAVHAFLKSCNIVTRKYFFPLCSDYPCYSSLPSARPENLPVAHRVTERVLCLPIYGELAEDTVKTICLLLRELHREAAARRP